MMKNFIYLLPLLLLCYSFLAAISPHTTLAEAPNPPLHKATFAGGCFWCMEKPFEHLPGVHAVISGYSGGTSQNPSYKNYAATGHIEVVEILFDPTKISYNDLLDVYWRQIDPTDAGGQFVDRGHAYTTAIFYHDDTQKIAAEESKEKLLKSGIFSTEIITPILPAPPFFAAEDYHQDYYQKNPIRYKFYRLASGRDKFLDKIWQGHPIPKNTRTAVNLKERLTPLQYHVTQEEGTEPAFNNAYWHNKKAGIYVDIVSNEPLFSSLDKFDSKTGWPSFTRPLVSENVVQRVDRRLFSVRTEVRSQKGDSHLGHVFTDGPPPTGLRYCINSAALRFVPVTDLSKEGFGEYMHLFTGIK